MERFNRHPSLLLLLGSALLAAANLRFGIGVLAWVAAVPFLRYLRLRPGIGGAAAVVGASAAAWTLAMAKICTGPVPLAFAPVYGVPLALTFAVPLIAYAALRRRLDSPLTPLAYPSAMVVGEWAQHALTPFGSWGAAAYTQHELLPLLQVAAVAGMAGPSFLVHLGNVAIEASLSEGSRARSLAAGAAASFVAAMVFGQARLASGDSGVETVRVAAVGTDATFAGLPFPGSDERRAIDDGIERRVRSAAAAGAKVVVTTEAAAIALPEEEAAWALRWSGLAEELGVRLVVGYVVPIQHDPFMYENKAVVFTPTGDGTITWLKHHPVVGEPAVPGTTDATWTPVGASRLGVAICYDADFGRLGLEQAAQALDLLALPSSDWRGIDPIHTDMARMRAIEGGYGIVRSTRLGRSAVVDALGRVRAYESAFDDVDGVLVADLPTRGVRTAYAALGDWLVLLCAAMVAAAGLAVAANSVHSPRWAVSSPSPVVRSSR